jgi:hypothetical protein
MHDPADVAIGIGLAALSARGCETVFPSRTIGSPAGPA